MTRVHADDWRRRILARQRFLEMEGDAIVERISRIKQVFGRRVEYSGSEGPVTSLERNRYAVKEVRRRLAIFD